MMEEQCRQLEEHQKMIDEQRNLLPAIQSQIKLMVSMHESST